jgi:hypothetical protein
VTEPLLVRSYTGGLANRLLSLATVSVIAAARQTTCDYLWLPDAHCPGDFADVFAPLATLGRQIGAAEWAERVTTPGRRDWWYGNWNHATLAERAAVLKISTQRLYRRCGVIFRQLQPAPKVRKRLEMFSREWRPVGDCIGVHIRRSDLNFLDKSAAQRDVQLFKLLDEYVADEPDTGFFVATDNPVSLEAMQKRYKARIFSFLPVWQNATALRRTSLLDAGVDLSGLLG